MEAAGGATTDAGPIERPAPDVRHRPPGVRESLSRSLDLALASSALIRRVSIYVGLLALALLGPAVVLFIVLARQLGSVDEAIVLIWLGSGGGEFNTEPGIVVALRISTICAVVGLFAVLIEAQIIVTAILGGVATGRPIGLRDALRLSRTVFWRVLAAAILVGILSALVSAVVTAVLDPSTPAAAGRAEVWQLVAGVVATSPFAFFLTGIVIGGVGPIEALRRSARVARARWRLAVLVVVCGAVVTLIQAFALGAGMDLLFRIGTVAGFGLDGSNQSAALGGVLVLAAIVAIGSLSVTVAALTVAPQVIVFLAMTEFSAGLDRAVPEGGSRTDRRPSLVTRPMTVLIVLGWVAAIVGLNRP